MSLKNQLNDLKQYAQIEDFYERYVKVNQFLHSLLIRKIISDYRIMSLTPDIEVSIKPYHTDYPQIELKL